MPALTRTACKTRTRTLLNEPTARFFTEDELNTWCNDAVRDISIKTYCMQHKGTAFETVAGTHTYAWPDTIQTTSVATLTVKTVINSNNVSLEYVTVEMMGRVNDSAIPKYTLWNRNIVFAPTPTAVYTYTPYIMYVAKQTAAGNLVLPSAYHHLVPLYMAAMGKAKRRDFDHSSTIFQTYNVEVNRIYGQLTGNYGPVDDRQRLKDQAPAD